MLATLLEVLGFILIVAAAALVSLPLALVTAGLLLIIGSFAFQPRRKDDT